MEGSFINRFSGNREWRMPIVGEGATELLYSDRHAYTVTRVSESGKTFWAKQDDAKRTDTNGYSESQTYEFTPNDNNPEVEVRWTKKGWKTVGGTTRFALGERDEYYDYSF